MQTVGSFLTNCYIVWCDKTKKALVIDPGFDRSKEADEILTFLREYELTVKYIIDTHGHPDHTCGNGIVKDATDAPILIHNLDAKMLNQASRRMMAIFGFHVVSPSAEGFLSEGDVIRLGESSLRVLHTPGHTPGSISLIVNDCFVFTGDTLFAGSIGRTDFPGGSKKDIMSSLKRKLAVLPDQLAVFPGHGPKSTIGQEKRTNPFLQDTFADSYIL